MKRDIRERLKAEVLLADGAMGTLLVSRGAPADGPRSPNALVAPELVKEIHDDYVTAGAQMLSTNTWDANRAKLSRFDWADSLEKINREAVRLARAAADGEYVYVAGAVGPLGQLVKPYGPLTKPHVREIFAEQIRHPPRGGSRPPVLRDVLVDARDRRGGARGARPRRRRSRSSRR